MLVLRPRHENNVKDQSKNLSHFTYQIEMAARCCVCLPNRLCRSSIAQIRLGTAVQIRLATQHVLCAVRDATMPGHALTFPVRNAV